MARISRLKLYYSFFGLLIAVGLLYFNGRYFFQSVEVVSEVKNVQPSITLKLMGGIANRLFLYASAFCIAKSKGAFFNVQEGSIPNNTNWNPILDGAFPFLSANITYGDTSGPSAVRIAYHDWAKYVPSIVSNPAKVQCIELEYLQSWKYFEACKRDIYKEFRFRSDDQNFAEKFLTSAGGSKRNTIFVGIHIRRGDMTTRKEKDAGFILPKEKFLKKALKYFEHKYSHKSIVYIVCSDGLDYAKRALRSITTNSTKVIFSEEAAPIQDLAILANCNHVIVTAGSFGWWGAYLSRGDVVYFNGFVRSNSHIGKGFSAEDYFPPHWVGFDDK